MTAHIHAALMVEYAKDAAETDKPWLRWQFQFNYDDTWHTATADLAFSPILKYRRKPIPLCQVEGKDVFPGDKLWQRPLCKFVEIGETTNRAGWLKDATLGCYYDPQFLSWSEPAKTKTVYQWAVKNNYGWLLSTYLYESEEAAREYYTVHAHPEIRRLDYTALEVPVTFSHAIVKEQA